MESIQRIAELRMLVGYLGEQAPGWWGSHFFGQSALDFLAPVFGRSAHQAQYHGALEAARRVHDEHIGVGRTLHLFHLPEQFEQGVAKLVADHHQVGDLLAHTDSSESAQLRLKGLAQPQQAAPGPVLVGEFVGSLESDLSIVAGLYLDAFQQGIHTYPYFREAV